VCERLGMTQEDHPAGGAAGGQGGGSRALRPAAGRVAEAEGSLMTLLSASNLLRAR
jgi:hypothetical protein